MEPKEHGVLAKFSRSSLIGSFTLIIFSLILGLFGTGFSFIIKALSLKQVFINMPDNFRNISLALLVVSGMSFSLIIAEKLLSNNLDDLEEGVGVNVLAIFSGVLTIVLLVGFYFLFSIFTTFLYNRFWS